MHSLSSEDPESRGPSTRASTPPPHFKRPTVRWEVNGPVWVLTDAIGVDHEIKDGESLTHARIEGYDLSGVLWHHVTLESVSFIQCRLANWELQHSKVRQVTIDDCVGGFVWKDSEISDAVVRKCDDESSVVRFFRSSIKTLTLSELQCGLEITRCHGDDVTIQNSRLKDPTLFHLSTLSSFRIVSSEVCGGKFSNTTMLGAELVEVSFTNGSWREVDLSSSRMRSVDFDHSRIDGLRLDLSELVLISFRNVRASDVTSTWSEWGSVEICGGTFGVSFESCTILAVMWYKVVTSITMIRTKGLGVRLIELYGTIRGQDTSLWRPVIRRSILDGDGEIGITCWGADMSSTLIPSPFGYFIEP